MNPERWKKVEAIFHAALDSDDREAFLDRSCDGDAALRAEVACLLGADGRASTLLDTPIAGALAAEDDSPRPALEPGTVLGPWRIRSEIASGGMGTVYLASRADGEYEQEAAVKLVRRGLWRAEAIERFRLERQTLARLSHPAIARLLDGGATPEGRPYLVMEYVEGRPIDEHCEARALPLDARLRLFRTVCDAVKHAHQNLVVHRDLKPSNILVTLDGAPKLLDFGIAKALSPDAAADAAPLVTRARAMTPEYASPEQVRGEPVTTATDVYSLGVLLYELLAGRHPHRPREGTDSSAPYVLERAICEEEPERPSRVAAAAGRAMTVPPDLDAIALMALRKEPERRYESVAKLADDVTRYLDGLPVLARSGGFAYRARKFVRRHRVAVTAVALLVVTIVLGVAGVAHSARLARERLAEVLRLSDLTRLAGFLVEADDLWPSHPRAVAAMEDWIARAGELGSRLDLHRRTLADVLSRAEPGSDAAPRFASTEDRWLHELLAKLVSGLEALVTPETGTIARVRERLEFARTVRRLTIDEPAAAWRETIDAVGASPVYSGLALAPQEGLVPIGKDPRSGLFEFAHVATGEIARRDPETGELVLEESTALVLVLLPGGTFTMGVEKPSAAHAPGSPNVDALAVANEMPAARVTLDAFFIAKHEMTQAQWTRVMKRNPSTYYPGYPDLPVPHTMRNPVEMVSWDDCAWLLPRIGLLIPTEAQWEYAARGGTTTPWWTGSDPRELEGASNVADVAAARMKAPWMVGLPPPLFDDGYPDHGPVEAHSANPFGLHGVIGNVAEWARDSFVYYQKAEPRPGDGERSSDDKRRVARGGSFIHPPESTRSTVRMITTSDFKPPTIGIRPSRRVEP